jgi:hypothetical protein
MFTPNFTTPEFFDTLQLLRRLFGEKLINQDFTVRMKRKPTSWPMPDA